MAAVIEAWRWTSPVSPQRRMQQIMLHCFLAVRSKLECKLGYFDLIGCDFLIDEDFKVRHRDPGIVGGRSSRRCASEHSLAYCAVPCRASAVLRLGGGVSRRLWEQLPRGLGGLSSQATHSTAGRHLPCVWPTGGGPSAPP